MGCMTWQGMSGNGVMTGMIGIITAIRRETILKGLRAVPPGCREAAAVAPMPPACVLPIATAATHPSATAMMASASARKGNPMSFYTFTLFPISPRRQPERWGKDNRNYKLETRESEIDELSEARHKVN